MTLVELLVVIVILVTLVAGVLPILSPNNDVRKIREAARELQTMVLQAQALAARSGRPAGIAFREATPGAGIAIEAEFLAEPPPFSGFSEDSTVRILVQDDALVAVFGSGMGDEFRPAATLPFPPGLLRVGDRIEAGGNVFRIRRGANTTTHFLLNGNEVGVAEGGVEFVVPVQDAPIDVVWENAEGQMRTDAALRYLIRRQPADSSATPVQFPLGVGIDLEASGPELNRRLVPDVPNPAPVQYGFTSLISQSLTQADGGNLHPFADYATLDPPQPITVGIMFGPDGHVTELIVNNERVATNGRIYLLMGRLENALPAYRTPQEFDALSDAQLAEERALNNWLDGDSRWLAIATQSGRAVVSSNAVINPRSQPNLNLVDWTQPQDAIHDSGDNQATRAMRIHAARQFAREMRSEGSG